MGARRLTTSTKDPGRRGGTLRGMFLTSTSRMRSWKTKNQVMSEGLEVFYKSGVRVRLADEALLDRRD